MAFNLQEFKGEFQLEGARPTLFQVELQFPVALGIGDASRKLTFTCKAAQLPGVTTGVIEVPYFGRKIKVAGDKTFQEWTITVINDEDFAVRNSFEIWQRGINSHVGNVRYDPAYKSVDARIRQFAKDGSDVPSAEYTMVGVWPSDISPIDVSWESNDAIEEFTVTMNYDWWENEYIGIDSNN